MTRAWLLLVLPQRLTAEGTEFTCTESGSITGGNVDKNGSIYNDYSVKSLKT